MSEEALRAPDTVGSHLPIRLFGHCQSGHTYKVAMALAMLRLPFEFLAVDLDEPTARRGADFAAASRFGEVPALVLEARSFVQSNAILVMLAERTGELMPDRPAALEWLFWESNRIGFSASNLRLARRSGGIAAATAAWLEERCRSDLDRLELEFADGRSFLLGPSVSIADLSCCGYLFWLDQAGLEVGHWPGVAAWLERIAVQPGWGHPCDLMPANRHGHER